MYNTKLYNQPPNIYIINDNNMKIKPEIIYFIKNKHMTNLWPFSTYKTNLYDHREQ